MKVSDASVDYPAIIEHLWSLLDDIDTVDDIAKGDDGLYRQLTRALQAKRWQTGITVDDDGQGIKLPDGEQMQQAFAAHRQAGIREGIEMAAKVAEEQSDYTSVTPYVHRERVAQAIRALAGEGEQ